MVNIMSAIDPLRDGFLPVAGRIRVRGNVDGRPRSVSREALLALNDGLPEITRAATQGLDPIRAREVRAQITIELGKALSTVLTPINPQDWKYADVGHISDLRDDDALSSFMTSVGFEASPTFAGRRAVGVAIMQVPRGALAGRALTVLAPHLEDNEFTFGQVRGVVAGGVLNFGGLESAPVGGPAVPAVQPSPPRPTPVPPNRERPIQRERREFRDRGVD